MPDHDASIELKDLRLQQPQLRAEHRTRHLVVRQQTAVINAIRARRDTRASAAGTRSHRSVDAAGLCEALSQTPQERCCRDQ
jgi:hypothetical protein